MHTDAFTDRQKMCTYVFMYVSMFHWVERGF